VKTPSFACRDKHKISVKILSLALHSHF